MNEKNDDDERKLWTNEQKNKIKTTRLLRLRMLVALLGHNNVLLVDTSSSFTPFLSHSLFLF